MPIQKLNAARKYYPIYAKETLSPVQALKDWRYYMFGSKIHVFTDYSATPEPEQCTPISSPGALV